MMILKGRSTKNAASVILRLFTEFI